ncbi:unnamed protein product [Ranitomeya imitator]|uniref:Uncharacterized protein n=1 Tax=Ranitomeya imitator TaxID=111125 RepID=A0ABN9MIU3_9NEOB|nr:unnamed protein product [Ranitomeya imitator]
MDCELFLQNGVSVHSYKAVISDLFHGSHRLKDADYHVPIHRDHQKFLRVSLYVQGGVKYYQYTALPFGLSIAQRVFTKLLWIVLQKINRAPSDEECFFDLLSKFQSNRMDDQRCTLEESQSGGPEPTETPVPALDDRICESVAQRCHCSKSHN